MALGCQAAATSTGLAAACPREIGDRRFRLWQGVLDPRKREQRPGVSQRCRSDRTGLSSVLDQNRSATSTRSQL
jgi:hypothetical protein